MKLKIKLFEEIIIAIYGQEIQKKLNDLNVFLIGEDALECELLKIFELMIISINEKSVTTITDNDLIETSNLNRQFLFRNKNIWKLKSKVAIMNKKFNCKYLEMYENNDGEEFFDEKFLQNQNYIFITVDSKTARKYIDNQCTQYDNEDLPEFSIPMCIKRNFTSKIEHCIEWGLDKFYEFFVLPIEDIKKFLENKEQLSSAIQNEDTSTVIINKMKKIKNLLKIIYRK